MSKSVLAALAALSLLTFVPASFAQEPAATPPGAAQPHHGMHEGHDPVAWHKQMCAERYAHAAGRLAYLEARLDLTEAQRAPFAALQKVALENAAKTRATCLANVPAKDAHPTILDKETKMVAFLTQRLQSLQASRPALEKLYEALTPEQREILDRLPGGGRHHGMHPGMMQHDMMQHGDGPEGHGPGQK